MKAPALLLTHAAAAGLGWAFMTTTFPETAKEAPQLPSKVDRSREASSPAHELIARIEAELPAAARPATDDQKRAALAQAAEAYLATHPLPDDLPAAVAEAFDGIDHTADNLEFGALLLAWGRRDLAAAIQWMQEQGGPDVLSISAAVFEKLGYEADPAAMLAQKELPLQSFTPFVKGLVRKIFATMSMDEIKQLVRDGDNSSVSELPYDLAAQWPAERSMELVDLAHSLRLPKLLDVHARSLGQNEGVLFLHRLLSLDLRPSFVRSILSGEIPTSFLAGAEGVSPAIRAEVQLHMGDVDFDAPDQEVASFRNELAGRDVRAFLSPDDQPEPIQAFKTGDTDALGLLREYQQRFPGYHEEPALRIQLFKELAKIDPVRAVVLLDFIDETGRRAEVESQLERNMGALPDLTYQLLSLLPPPEDIGVLRVRFDYWQKSARRFGNQYQEDYQYWAEHLPAGVDRDLALAVLANAMEEKRPQDAARLREQIARDEIRSFR